MANELLDSLGIDFEEVENKNTGESAEGKSHESAEDMEDEEDIPYIEAEEVDEAEQEPEQAQQAQQQGTGKDAARKAKLAARMYVDGFEKLSNVLLGLLAGERVKVFDTKDEKEDYFNTTYDYFKEAEIELPPWLGLLTATVLILGAKGFEAFNVRAAKAKRQADEERQQAAKKQAEQAKANEVEQAKNSFEAKKAEESKISLLVTEKEMKRTNFTCTEDEFKKLRYRNDLNGTYVKKGGQYEYPSQDILALIESGMKTAEIEAMVKKYGKIYGG